jgi:hypothetical protein
VPQVFVWHLGHLSLVVVKIAPAVGVVRHVIVIEEVDPDSAEML